MTGAQWALFVAYNRDKRLIPSNTVLGASCDFVMESYDIIQGPIADDRMGRAFNDFLENLISIRTLKAALDMYNLGEQVVLKSQKACEYVVCGECQGKFARLELPDLKTQNEHYTRLVIEHRYIRSPVLDDLLTKYSNLDIMVPELQSF